MIFCFHHEKSLSTFYFIFLNNINVRAEKPRRRIYASLPQNCHTFQASTYTENFKKFQKISKIQTQGFTLPKPKPKPKHKTRDCFLLTAGRIQKPNIPLSLDPLHSYVQIVIICRNIGPFISYLTVEDYIVSARTARDYK